MKKFNENNITFTTTKKGEHVELRIAVAGWEGEVNESGVNYVATPYMAANMATYKQELYEKYNEMYKEERQNG